MTIAMIESVCVYDHDTLTKVYAALEKTLTREQATDCVSAMQSAGVLFRERKP